DNYFRLWKPKKDDVVFDLGVCEGLFGYRIKDCVAQVHLFEPTPRIAAALRKTFETELTAGRAVVHECAIGEREGKVDFAVNIENLGRSGLATSGAANEACRVRMTTIDGVVEECEIDCLDVIEMDIEGAELQGLRGAVNTLRRLKPNLLICTYHREDDIPTIPRFLGENGYRITAYNCSYRQSR
ncbi:MAG: FkbM family methyltransferase, partial [Verrucomicrobia bacterium]|nr:FkbM family methyltransferase [Verrucomicrobiota bacterium]